MKFLKSFGLAAASVFFFASCQQEFVQSVSPGGSDSVRVALRLGAATDSLPDSLYFKAKWVRVQFTTNTTDKPLKVDTILPLSQGRYLSPAIPKSVGYSAVVTGIDSTGRKVWGGSGTGKADGNDKVVAVAGSLAIPLAVVKVLSVDSASLLTGAIDFPDTLSFPAISGVRRVMSLDSLHWSVFPADGVKIDSSMTVFVQAQSTDTLTGAPFSPVTRFSFTGKTVATPKWSIDGNRYFPGQSVKAALSCSTKGAAIQWTNDGGATWTNHTDSIAIESGKTYQARATKAHQPTSAIAPQAWQWLSSDSAALATLSIGTATLSPAFDPSKLNYVTDSVWAQAYVTVTATPKVNGVKVTCNGAACAGQQFTISDTGTFIQVETSINGTPGLIYAVRVPRHGPVSVDTAGWNTESKYSTMIDIRDGQQYRTVKIGTQTWMAQNLNYKVDSSLWYNNIVDSGSKYGSLYGWEVMMGEYTSSTSVPSGVRGICPDGWHIPSLPEWDVLISYVGGSSKAGTSLKSSVYWVDNDSLSGNGLDTYGFRALPSGILSGSGFQNIGMATVFWSATQLYSVSYSAVNLNYGSPTSTHMGGTDKERLSIRCIMN